MKNIFQRFVDCCSNGYGDNWNPVLVKEMRQNMRSRMFAGMLICTGFGYLFACYIAVAIACGWISDGKLTQDICKNFLMIYGFCVFLVALIAGSVVTMRWSVERAGDGISPEFTTPLGAWAIVWGKFSAMLLSGAGVIAVNVPVLLFFSSTMAKMPTIAFLGIPFALLVACYAAELFLAVASTPKKGRFNQGGNGLIVIVAFILLPLFSAFMRDNPSAPHATRLIYWSIFGIGLLGLITAHALVLPVAANRMLLPRTALILYWLGTCAVFKFGGVAEKPIQIWCFTSYFFAVALLWSAALERFDDTKRMRDEFARIPSPWNVLYRLFSTGSRRAFLMALLVAGVGSAACYDQESLSTLYGFAAFFCYAWSYSACAVALRKRTSQDPLLLYVLAVVLPQLPVLMLTISPAEYWLSALSPMAIAVMKPQNAFFCALACAVCASAAAAWKKTGSQLEK